MVSASRAAGLPAKATGVIWKSEILQRPVALLDGDDGLLAVQHRVEVLLARRDDPGVGVQDGRARRDLPDRPDQADVGRPSGGC